MLCSVYGPGGDEIVGLFRSLPEIGKKRNLIIRREESSDFAGLHLSSSRGERSVWIIKSADINSCGDFGRASVITCGLSQRDSISVSSISDKLLTISVQRELPTLENKTVCQQDIQMRCEHITDAETAAVAAGGLLCMGVKPAGLLEIIF